MGTFSVDAEISIAYDDDDDDNNDDNNQPLNNNNKKNTHPISKYLQPTRKKTPTTTTNKQSHTHT